MQAYLGKMLVSYHCGEKTCTVAGFSVNLLDISEKACTYASFFNTADI